MSTHAEGNPQAGTHETLERDKVAHVVVIVAIAALWEEWRGTGAEKPILDELALRVREYKTIGAPKENP